MDDPIETTTLRLHAVGVVDKPDLPKIAARKGEMPALRSRTVHSPTVSSVTTGSLLVKNSSPVTSWSARL